MVIHLVQAGLVWFGGQLILDGGMTFGTFMQFWIYSAMLTEPIKQLGEKYNVLQSAFASAERIFQILDEPVDGSVFEAALAAFQRAHELGDQEAWLGLQHRASVLAAWPGHTAEAVEAYRLAMAVATELGSEVGMQRTLGGSLGFAQSVGDLDFQAETLEVYVRHQPHAVSRWVQLASVQAGGGARPTEAP